MNKAKCEIKLCCFRDRKLETCADCTDYPCRILEAFWGKNGWKYGQDKRQLEFIRQHGYKEFLKKANTWKTEAELSHRENNNPHIYSIYKGGIEKNRASATAAFQQ
ncbi:MAG: hypothetical protein NWE94_06590 [Candidatus Bathyarchaeota archaeon]|nr:hypothetical protein [Candidatus Bathyarchaeota archaeon]